ncbi:MAG: hypothetical protein JWR09_2589 [Mucilaginibacter sp.]|nr:hypothetical protein [Mucilaginibacter sp.]
MPQRNGMKRGQTILSRQPFFTPLAKAKVLCHNASWDWKRHPSIEDIAESPARRGCHNDDK